ncbi:MAG: helix-turn-helix domain-containing protein [Sporichthyaceae bacterium]
MDGWQLRERRRRAGLTLGQVARAAGTAESNVSAYERGAKKPGVAAAGRIEAAIDAGRDGVVHARSLLTVPAAAAALRAGLRAGWPTADLLRVVRQMRTDLRHLEGHAEPQWLAFLAAPSTTGDQRWDAMLAGVIEGCALSAGRPVPAWTAGRVLERFWWVGEVASLRAYCFAHSPFSLQIRGVLVDPTDLEAV